MSENTQKNKREKIIFSPIKVTEALKEMGEEYTRKDALMSYMGILIIAIILSLMFELRPLYMAIVGIAYLLFVPQLYYNQKKQTYELRRFNDINAYMSQIAQSFTGTSNILESLEETASTFTEGKMKNTLMESIELLNQMIGVEEAIEEAFKHIEKEYRCEKLLNLHEFLLMAQKRGGDSEKEFVIIEKTRTAWEKAVEKYRKELVSVRNGCSLLYGLMLLLCVIIMNAFPEELSIIHLEFIQIVNTILLVLFIVFFVTLDKKINSSLLKDPKFMSREEADRYFAKIQGASSEKERKKQTAYTVIISVTVAAVFFLNPSPIKAAISIVIIIAAVNMHNIELSLTIAALKNEILKAFPNWLFDVTLLMQRESIDSAVLISSSYAPPVLQAELQRIGNLIKKNQITEAYTSFFADFNILHIETSMRKLYSLSIGAQTKAEVMHFIIENNMEILTEAEKKSIEMKSDVSSLYQFIPLLVTSVGMLMYCLALIGVSLDEVLHLLG